MSVVSWVFRVINRVSSPSRAVVNDIERLIKAARQGQQAVEGMLREMGAGPAAARALSFALRGVALAKGGLTSLQQQVGQLRQSLHALGQSVVNLPNLIVASSVGLAAKGLIDQVGFVEQQRIALSTLLDSPIRGTATLDWAIKFADVTPFETPEVLESVRTALAMGFKTTQIDTLLTTLGDAASGTGSRMSDLVLIFGQMRAAGKLTTQDLNQLAVRGMGAWEWLAKGLGKSVPEVRKMVELGQINSATGMRILVENMRRQYGGMMQEQSRTIFGLASTLKSRVQTIAFRLDQSRALEPLRTFMSNLVALTDFSRPPGSRIGVALEQGLGRIFKAAFGPLAQATTPEQAAAKIERFAARAEQVVQRVREALPQVAAYANTFAAGVGDAARVLRSLWQAGEGAVAFLSRLTGGSPAAEAGMSGLTGGFLRLAGAMTGLLLGFRLLNLLTLGGAGSLLRFAAILGGGLLGALQASTLAFLRWRAASGSMWALQILTQPGGPLAGLAALLQSGLAGIRAIIAAKLLWGRTALSTAFTLARAWLIGLGPVGWVIAAITAVVGIAVWAYGRFAWFREGVGAAISWLGTAWQAMLRAFLNYSSIGRLIQYIVSHFDGLKAAGKGLLGWFTSLPQRIGDAFAQLPQLLRSLLKQAIDLLPPGVREVVRGLVGGLLDGKPQVGQASAQVAAVTEQRFKGPLQIKSPSRRFAYFGQMLGAGLERGLMGSAAAVERAVAQMTQAALPPAPQPALASALGIAPAIAPVAPRASAPARAQIGSVNIHLSVSSQARDPKVVADELARVLPEILPEALTVALEKAALEVGYEP